MTLLRRPLLLFLATLAARPALAQTGDATNPLSDAEAASFAAALKAVDEARYTDARAMVANFNQPLLIRYIEWSILRAAPRTDATFAATWRFLQESPDWPEPEVLRRQAEDRIGPDTPPAEVWRYFKSFPPLTSAGTLRRLEAASAVSPGDVARLAADSWRAATFRPSDESDFLLRYSQYLTPADTVGRFDRLLREGRPQVARELLSRLPPDYQPLANARLAMAARTPEAASLLKAVSDAKLDEPAILLERLRWLRQTGNLDEARKLLASPNAPQSEAWANERLQLARDLLAAGRAADAYAVSAPHGLAKGAAFAEAEFFTGWLALRFLKRTDEALKHFQTLYDGVGTDISRSRAAYWLRRAPDAGGPAQDPATGVSPAAPFGPTFFRQLATRPVPRRARPRARPGAPGKQLQRRRGLVVRGARPDAASAGHGARGGRPR